MVLLVILLCAVQECLWVLYTRSITERRPVAAGISSGLLTLMSLTVVYSVMQSGGDRVWPCILAATVTHGSCCYIVTRFSKKKEG